MRNLQVRIRRLPVGLPTPDDFELATAEVPSIAAGQMLLRTHWLSLDPYVRALMSGRHFLGMPQPGQVMPAAAVAEVLESRNAGFQVGELLVLPAGLQEFALSDGATAWRLHSEHRPHSTALGILGVPGMTAYFGLRETARLRPGDTVLVSAASGPVGCMVGQLAMRWGGRAIGVAGSAEKCRWVTEHARFDACIDYRSENVGERLRQLAPRGVDVFFDNTGGSLQQLVIGERHLAMHGRVILCGMIEQYNLQDAPPGPNLGALMASRGRIEPIIVYDYENRREEFFSEALPLHSAGLLAYKEDIVDGLENAAGHFCHLMRGQNFGKTLVRMPPQSTSQVP